MKASRIAVVAVLVASLMAVPSGAWGIHFWLCAGTDMNKDCNKCSDYFSKPSRDSAEAKCKRMGYPDTMGFPTLGHLFAWERVNCTCPDDD